MQSGTPVRLTPARRAAPVLLVDVGAAVIAAIVVLALTPGLAVAGAIAIVVLIGCGLSFRRGSRLGRRGRRARPRPATRVRSRQR